MCLPVKPYKIEREWKHLDLSCAVVQNREAMHRCGYVRVPPTHPCFGKNYNDVNVEVHGGLTFGDIEPCTEHEDGQGFWFGFDCAHSDDLCYDPKADLSTVSEETRQVIEIDKRFPLTSCSHYWTEEEVVEETNKLAEQLWLMQV